MAQLLRRSIGTFLFTLLLVSAVGCNPPTPAPGASGTDTTPPGFLSVSVQLVGPTQPTDRGDFDITAGPVSKSKLGAEISIQLSATAGDSESGITDIQAVSDMFYACGVKHGGELVGALQEIALPFPANAKPSSAVSLWQLNTTVNPIVAAECAQNDPVYGTVNVSGYVFARVTNGAGLTTDSPRFAFDYADVGNPS